MQYDFVYKSVVGDRGGKAYSVHAHDCVDAFKEADESGGDIQTIDAMSLDAAISEFVADVSDLGYSADDIKIYPCAKSGIPKERKPLAPGLCPASGTRNTNPSPRFYVPCPTCGKSVKNGSTYPRHKPGSRYTGGRTRQCESCGLVFPDGKSRRRNKEGKLLCDRCQAGGTGGVYGVNEKLAHDQGDGAIINHCPFCGGGSIIGRGDGTAECQFCKTQTPGSGVFTVQVQPQHSGFPQTNPMTGEPINLPDTPGAPQPGPADPSNYEPPADQYLAPGEEDIQGEEQPIKTDQSAAAETGKPWTAKKYFITQDGIALDEETYQRHLALHFARSPGKMIEQIGLRVGKQ